MRKIIILTIVLSLLVLSNCGYKLSGFGNQLPEHVRSIMIPDFENKTTRIEAEQFVTFAVREEFIRRSKLALVDDQTEADSLLEGTISSFNVTPVNMTSDASANVYRLQIVLKVRLIDLTNNRIIFENESISFSDTYDIEGEEFFSQETEKLQEVAERFAESVVSTILENF